MTTEGNEGRFRSLEKLSFLTSFMSQNNAGSVAEIAKAVVKAMGKQLLSSQEKLGDDKLNQARDLVTGEVQSIIGEGDLRIIEERIR
jgi:hypothetical protein